MSRGGLICTCRRFVLTLETVMIRALAAGVILVLVGAAAAQTAPGITPVISVDIGAPLAAKIPTYGARDVDELKTDLRNAVARALDRAHGGPCRPTRVALILVDATPNHPTFKQIGDNPGLDMLRSRSLGGADILAQLQCADGRPAHVHESYAETDIRMARAASTWSDAELAIDLVARRIAHGDFDRP
ncbi:MAG: hypothetical protein AB1429_16590 [Pseudomonadota bacterium]|jgi:hypothetical protein